MYIWNKVRKPEYASKWFATLCCSNLIMNWVFRVGSSYLLSVLEADNLAHLSSNSSLYFAQSLSEQGASLACAQIPYELFIWILINVSENIVSKKNYLQLLEI